MPSYRAQIQRSNKIEILKNTKLNEDNLAISDPEEILSSYKEHPEMLEERMDINEDDEFLEQFTTMQDENDDEWLHKKVYEGSEHSIGECVNRFMKYFLEHTITKKALYDLFEMVHEYLPRPNFLPKNKYELMKFLDRIMPSNEVITKL
ncbi:hypothetical protein TKK_0001612 [Trichogramma kaykai]